MSSKDFVEVSILLNNLTLSKINAHEKIELAIRIIITLLTTIFQSAMSELIKTKSKSSMVQSARVTRVVEVSVDKELKNVEKNFTYLATVGSTAPFIGLFGTVWGIMNSFQSIAISRNTSLAIVAPGIAEALFATALGLLAAIPAVIAYNKFNSDSQRYFSKIENFCKRFLSII